MEFSEKIKSALPTLVNFHATWCGPCKAMKPNLDAAVQQLGDKIGFERIDVDQNNYLARLYQIRSIPTTIIFKNGEVIWRETGVYTTNQLVKVVEESINK